jgi:hypothetical protein
MIPQGEKRNEIKVSLYAYNAHDLRLDLTLNHMGFFF